MKYDAAVYIFKSIYTNFRWIFWLFQTVDLELSNLTWKLEVDFQSKLYLAAPSDRSNVFHLVGDKKSKSCSLMLNIKQLFSCWSAVL